MELIAFGERGCGGIARVNRHRMDDVSSNMGVRRGIPSSGAEQ